jgi:hypothetical protein
MLPLLILFFSGYGLSIEPEAGFLWGQAQELVYRDESSEDLSSGLSWNFKPLWYLGAAAEFAQTGYAGRFGLFASLNARFALPMQAAGIYVYIFRGRVFSGNIFFHSGPIVKYLGRDEHHLKVNTGQYVEYRDGISGGYILQSGAEFRFSPARRFSISLDFFWRRLAAKPHGNSGGAATGYLGSRSFHAFGNLSGASIQMVNCGLTAIIRP